MGDGDAKPGAGPAAPPAPKPPSLPKGAPKEIVDFVECRAAKLTLKGGKQAWIGKIGIGDLTIEPEVTFGPGDTPGSINASVGQGMVAVTVAVSVKNGDLEVDSSNLPFESARDAVTAWVKDFNAYLKSKGKRLGALSLKDGQVTGAKEDLPATVKPAGGGVKDGPVMPAPGDGGPDRAIGGGATRTLIRATAGAIVMVGVALGVGLSGYGDHGPVGTTVESPTQVTSGAADAGTAPVAGPGPTPTPDAASAGMVCVKHSQGYSTIQIFLADFGGPDGPYQASLGQGPTGPVNGSGALAAGHGEVDIRIMSYGTYNGLSLTDPSGTAVGLGPLGPLFPFTVTAVQPPCDHSSVDQATAPAPTPTPSPQPAVTPNPTDAPGQAAAAPVQLSSTRTTDVPPWSLLFIPGAILMAGGVLLLGRDGTLVASPAPTVSGPTPDHDCAAQQRAVDSASRDLADAEEELTELENHQRGNEARRDAQRARLDRLRAESERVHGPGADRDHATAAVGALFDPSDEEADRNRGDAFGSVWNELHYLDRDISSTTRAIKEKRMAIARIRAALYHAQVQLAACQGAPPPDRPPEASSESVEDIPAQPFEPVPPGDGEPPDDDPSYRQEIG